MHKALVCQVDTDHLIQPAFFILSCALPLHPVFFIDTRYDNLIPGMAAASHWGVESGKLMYPSTFGHVPTFVYMSHRPNKLFVPRQQRK
jgi:hypothetical protein